MSNIYPSWQNINKNVNASSPNLFQIHIESNKSEIVNKINLYFLK